MLSELSKTEDGKLSFGQKAVGLAFNPSGSEAVIALKTDFAGIIDFLDKARNHPNTSPEQKRLLSIAITEAQGAQMWAVKAATWED